MKTLKPLFSVSVLAWMIVAWLLMPQRATFEARFWPGYDSAASPHRGLTDGAVFFPDGGEDG